MYFRNVGAAALIGALVSSGFFLSGAAQADGFQTLGLLPGTSSANARAISDSGLFVVGRADSSDDEEHGFLWSAGAGMVAIDGFPAATDYLSPVGVSDNGSVIIGSFGSYSGGSSGSFIWTSTDGWRNFGTLAGDPGLSVESVSGDGSTVIGSHDLGLMINGIIVSSVAFRWTAANGLSDLGVLPGMSFHWATSVSRDGAVIAGTALSSSFNGARTWRWTVATGTVSLGTVGDFQSVSAGAMSADGNVIVGSLASSSTLDDQWYRWTQAGGMVALGTPVGSHYVNAPVGVSLDGSVIVGTVSYSGDSVPVRWTSATGYRTVADLLTSSGVDLHGIYLNDVVGLSSDGTVIAGNGNDSNGRSQAWLAVCASAYCNALLSHEDTTRSIAGVGLVGQSTNGFVGNGLNSLGETALQHQAGSSPLSVFGSGFYDSDPVGAASVGATYDLGTDRLVGISIGESYIDTPMLYDGVSRLWGTSLGAFVAQNPDEGLQWLASISGSYFTGDINRAYANGAALSKSQGDVDGNGIGAQLRVGYSLRAHASDALRLTPFASYAAVRSHLDGYTESNGAAPASFKDQTYESQTLRLGSDAKWNFTPDTWAFGTLAWGHRLDDVTSQTVGVTGTLVGTSFALTAPVADAAENWIETTAGLRMPLGDAASLTASLTAITPSGYSTTYQARLGVAYNF